MGASDTDRVLRHEVLDELRSDILTGRIPPGVRLREGPLAAGRRVSRGPVREAIRQLEQEGLVLVEPHRGGTVVGVPEDEVETIYELRAELEGMAFERAALRVSAGDLDELTELVARMVALSGAGDVEGVTDLDLRFHGRVIELSGFRFLRHLWASIDGLVRWRVTRSSQLLGIDEPAAVRAWLIGPSREHEGLVDALRSGDPARAGGAARHHVRQAIERLGAQRSR